MSEKAEKTKCVPGKLFNRLSRLKLLIPKIKSAGQTSWSLKQGRNSKMNMEIKQSDILPKIVI